MDLKSEGSLVDGNFGTGVTFASFHSAGVWPLAIQSLKSLQGNDWRNHSSKEMHELMHHLVRWPCMSSAPVVLALLPPQWVGNGRMFWHGMLVVGAGLG